MFKCYYNNTNIIQLQKNNAHSYRTKDRVVVNSIDGILTQKLAFAERSNTAVVWRIRITI